MKKLIILLLIGAAMAALIIKGQRDANQIDTPLLTHTVSTSAISDSILASGNLTFAEQVALRSEVMGVVTEIWVEEGQQVHKGQPLLQLDRTNFEADVKQAQAAVDIQHSELERLQEVAQEALRKQRQIATLVKQELMDEDRLLGAKSRAKLAQIDLQTARHRMTQLQALLTQKQDNLSKTEFTAPIDGLVVSVDIKAGETVIAGTTNIIGSALLTIADTSSYVAQVRVDEADLATIKLEQQVQVFPAAVPNQPLQGHIVKIATQAKRNQAGQGLYYQVEVALNANTRHFPGMSCRAEVQLQQHSGSLTVPVAAIQQEQDQHFVWVASDNRVEKRPVTLGIASDLEQVIESGLEADEQVVIGPGRQLAQLQPDHRINTVERL